MEATTLDRPETADEQEQTAPPESELGDGGLVMEGSGQLSMAVGGKRPDSSSLRLTGGKFELENTQFEKGERLRVSVERADGVQVFAGSAVVDEISSKDVTDSKTQQVVGSERRHRVRIAG